MQVREVENSALDDLVVETNEQQVDALKHLSNAPHGRGLGRLAGLVGDGLIVGLELLAKLAFGERIDNQGQPHDHDQGHDASRAFEKKAVGKEEGVAQEAKAPLNGTCLLLVAVEQGSVGKFFLLQIHWWR